MIKIVILSILMALNIKIIQDYTKTSLAQGIIHPFFMKKKGINTRICFIITSKIGEILYFIFPFFFVSWYLAICIIISTIIVAKLLTAEGPLRSEESTITSWFVSNIFLILGDIWILNEIIKKYM